MSMQKLWTKNFTIITLGTVVSMLGNAISGFAIGLLVLDYTDSTFLFALFMVVYNLPKIIMPMLAGPYLDNFSRARVIYSLDFLSSALYLGIYFLLRFDLFSYGPFLALAFLIGAIDGVYQVAYDSLYPTLISPGNLMRAYSISSMIAPVSMVMVPVAAYLYEVMGRLDPLFLFNALSFLVAACFETQIRAPETQTLHHDAPFTPAKFREDFRAGLRYLRGERGLQIITAYFFVYMFAFGASGTVVLPYFKMHEDLGMLWYCFVMGGGVLGRLLGGAIQYRYRFPTSRKFAVAILIGAAGAIVEGVFLYFPVGVMMPLCLASGLSAVICANLRVSSTQSYVPDAYRGRFNGVFQMICALGTISGQLLSGAVADTVGERPVLAAFMLLNLLAVLGILWPGRRAVRPIYNRDA